MMLTVLRLNDATLRLNSDEQIRGEREETPQARKKKLRTAERETNRIRK